MARGSGETAAHSSRVSRPKLSRPSAWKQVQQRSTFLLEPIRRGLLSVFTDVGEDDLYRGKTGNGEQVEHAFDTLSRVVTKNKFDFGDKLRFQRSVRILASAAAAGDFEIETRKVVEVIEQMTKPYYERIAGKINQQLGIETTSKELFQSLVNPQTEEQHVLAKHFALMEIGKIQEDLSKDYGDKELNQFAKNVLADLNFDLERKNQDAEQLIFLAEQVDMFLAHLQAADPSETGPGSAVEKVRAAMTDLEFDKTTAVVYQRADLNDLPDLVYTVGASSAGAFYMTQTNVVIFNAWDSQVVEQARSETSQDRKDYWKEYFEYTNFNLIAHELGHSAEFLDSPDAEMKLDTSLDVAMLEGPTELYATSLANDCFDTHVSRFDQKRLNEFVWQAPYGEQIALIQGIAKVKGFDSRTFASNLLELPTNDRLDYIQTLFKQDPKFVEEQLALALKAYEKAAIAFQNNESHTFCKAFHSKAEQILKDLAKGSL